MRLNVLLALVSSLFLIQSAGAEVTYSKDVAPIMQANCQQCHRPNDIAPFALMSYEDAQTYAEDIRRTVSQKTMPPWKPVDGFGKFRDAYGLTNEQRQTILDWVDAGAPQGDPADLPAPPPVSDSPWQLGNPDVVLTMPEYTVPRAKDTYRCFVLPAGTDEDRFVSAVQALPGDKQMVHHVLLFVDTIGASVRLDGQDGQPGYTCFGGPGIPLGLDGGVLGGWVPGMRVRNLPEGIGLRLRGKTRLVMQVHYHPNGRSGTDKTQVGIWFSPKDSVKQTLYYLPILNESFKIPPGADNYPVSATFPIIPGLDGKLIIVAPHMHLLGRTIKVEIQDPDGMRRPMIYIDDWDFNWQGFYTFEDPMAVKAGATIRLSATYDNSDKNPRNPNNPLKAVGWGEGTEDEMCLAFIGIVFDRTPAFIPLVKTRNLSN